MIRTALLSPCGRYRYLLGRTWNDLLSASGSPRIALWVMLNPSTADAEIDDATVRRCIGFSKAQGFDGLEVANLYALRSRDPFGLTAASNPIGPETDQFLNEAADRAEVIVAAWGGFAMARASRAPWVTELLSRRGPVLCLGKTLKGDPRHPLYVPAAAKLEVYAEKARIGA